MYMPRGDVQHKGWNTVVPIPDTKQYPQKTAKVWSREQTPKMRGLRNPIWGGGKAIEFCSYQHFQMCITELIHPLLVSCLEPCFRVSAVPASPWRGEITVRETMTSSPKEPLLQHLPILQNTLNIFRMWNWSWKGRWWYMPVILALEKEAEGPQTGSHPGLHRHVLSLKSGRENEKKIICLRKCKFTLGIPKKNNN